MDESSLEQFPEIIECAVAKFPIRSFGKKSEKIKSYYPDAKLLVFSSEPWKLLGTHVTILNNALGGGDKLKHFVFPLQVQRRIFDCR